MVEPKHEVRFVIEIGTNGETNIRTPLDKGARIIEKPEELQQIADQIVKEGVKKVEIGPLSTYFELNSGVVFINGKWVKIG